MKKISLFIPSLLIGAVLLISFISFSNQTYAVTSGPSMTICQFVELMISIGAVAPGNIANARTQMNCTAPSGGVVYTPSVDLRVNGQNGPINLSGPGNVNISWNALNVTSCRNSAGTVALSGSQSVSFNRSQNIGITCTGPLGTVSDSVQVNISSSNSTVTNTPNILEISCSANPSNISLNNSITWQANATGGTGNYTYSWVGDVSGNSRNVSRQYTIAGSKVATVVVSSGDRTAAASCSANVGQTATSTVTANSLEVMCIPSHSVAVVGEPVTWLSVAAGGSLSKTYSWSGSDGLSSSNSSTTKTYSTVGTKTAQILVTSGSLSATNNCTILVTANSTSTSSSTNSFGNNSFGSITDTLATSTTMAPDGTCLAYPSTAEVNKPVVWNVLPRNGNGLYTYSWSGSDGLYGLSSLITKIYSTTGSKTATVRIDSNQQSASVTCSANIQAAGTIANSTSGFGTNSTGSTSGTSSNGSTSGTSSGSPFGTSGTTIDPSAEIPAPSTEDPSSSGSEGLSILTPFSGMVSALVPCITQYYPYEEDYSKKQAVLIKCTGGSSSDGSSGGSDESAAGYGDGYILVNTGRVMPSQTVLGQAMMGDPICINPPGKFNGIPVEMNMGDSCADMPPPLEEEDSGGCDYSGSQKFMQNPSVSLSSDFVVKANITVGNLPDCGGTRPRIFFANNQKDYTLEMFSLSGSSFGFRVANRKVSFTQASVGSIRSPGGTTDHYAIGTAGVSGTHEWIIKKVGSKVTITKDGAVVGEWTISGNSGAPTVSSFSLPPWVTGSISIESGTGGTATNNSNTTNYNPNNTNYSDWGVNANYSSSDGSYNVQGSW